MADQLNALPDPSAPAGAQQVAEPAQNPPQELEPIAEPAAAPARPSRGNFILVSASLYVGVSLAPFVGDFFCLARLAFCLWSRNFLYGFRCCFGARYKHSVSTCPFIVHALLNFFTRDVTASCVVVYCPRFP